METILLKAQSVEIKQDGDSQGTVVANVTKYNTLHYDDSILQKGSIPDKDNIAVSQWNHSSIRGTEPPVTYAKGYSDGDYYKVKIDYDLGDAIQSKSFNSIQKAGDVQEYSVGIIPKDYSFDEDHTMIIKQADIYEISPVIKGASPDTGTVTIKDFVAANLKDDSKEDKDLAAKVKELEGEIETLKQENKELKEFATSTLTGGV